MSATTEDPKSSSTWVYQMVERVSQSPLGKRRFRRNPEKSLSSSSGRDSRNSE